MPALQLNLVMLLLKLAETGVNVPPSATATPPTLIALTTLSAVLLMTRVKKAIDVPTDPLDAMLARLQLSGICDQLDNLLDEAARERPVGRQVALHLFGILR